MTPADPDRRLAEIDAEARQIAHDLNNAIGVIINYAAFVAEELDPSSRAHRDLDQIQRAAEQAAELSHRLRRVCD